VQRIIDTHIHLSERRDDSLLQYARNNGLRYNLDELLGIMRRHRVERGLLLSPPLDSGAPLPNEEIIRLCQKSGGRLSPVITAESTKKEVRAAIEIAEKSRRDVKAFKIRLGYTEASAQSPVFEELYDYAEEEGLPVLFHTGDTANSAGDLALSHPLTLDRLANRRRELTVVLCHFGNPWFADVAELIYKHPSVYTDISGLTTGGGAYARQFLSWLATKISEAIYYAGGAEKVLFGTDYPVTRYTDALTLVKALAISRVDKERILWRNAAKVFRL